MPTLTRRRSPDRREECWHVYYGDVHAGTIALRTGNPHDTDPWEWRCGFYPGSRPGECQSGTAATFHEARADFEAAWRVFLSNRTEADFDEWRRSSAWSSWKYAMWDKGCRMPAQSTDGRARCFCGETIDIAGTPRHVYAAHMADAEYAGR
jgi:hypothetical protein